MQTWQWPFLGASVTFGIAWIFQLQNWIMEQVFPMQLTGPGMKIDSFILNSSSPAFTVFWLGCMVALIIWIGTTWAGSPPSSSREVRQKQPQWWLAAGLLTIFGFLCMSWFTVFFWVVTQTSPVNGSDITYYPIPPAGVAILAILILFDVVILFWLPTVLASPRTYRLVVPGAVKLFGGR